MKALDKKTTEALVNDLISVAARYQSTVKSIRMMDRVLYTLPAATPPPRIPDK